MTDPVSTAASQGHLDPRRPAAFRISRLAMLAFALASLPFLSWFACATKLVDPQDEGVTIWIVSVIASLLGALLGVVNTIRLARDKSEERPTGVRWSIAATLAGVLSPVITFILGALTTNIGPIGMGGAGRPLWRRGRARATASMSRTDWTDATCRALALKPSSEAAASWRRLAAAEHASVASFSHLSNTLLALGAPSSLVAATHECALDEVRHTRIAYGIAAALDGRDEGPAPFPWALVSPGASATRWSGLAESTLREACIAEGAAARALRDAAREPSLVPALRPVIEAIAADEERHATLGFEIVAWIAAQDPRAVTDATNALAADEGAPPELSARTASNGVAALTSLGVVGAERWARAVDATRREVLSRLDGLVLSRTHPGGGSPSSGLTTPSQVAPPSASFTASS